MGINTKQATAKPATRKHAAATDKAAAVGNASANKANVVTVELESSVFGGRVDAPATYQTASLRLPDCLDKTSGKTSTNGAVQDRFERAATRRI